MSEPRLESAPSPAAELAQLHEDVAAFNAEMRSAPRADPRKAWLPFSLGAALALAVFMLVTLLPRLV